MMNERDRISAVRMQMLEMHPFWGYLLLQVRLIPDARLPTLAATDCIRRIWYNPELTKRLTMAELGFVMAHEIGHHVYATLGRQRGRDPNLWNRATDYAINRIVAAIPRAGMRPAPLYKLPEGGLDDRRFDGMIAESIYEVLAEEDVRPPMSLTLVLDDGEDGHMTLPVSDHGGGIDVHLPGGLSDSDVDELRERIAGAVETWRRSDQRGHLPGDLVRDLDRLRRPRVPWQRLFRRFVGQALAKDDYSLARPNKRYLFDDLVVPGPYGERIGRIVVALDTSGSMTADQLASVASELRPLAELAEDVTLIVADAEVQEIVPHADLDVWLRKGSARGGGGTDHRPVFEAIDELRLAPELFVGLTDLYSEFPERRPRYPVIWVTPERHGRVPWGQVVVMDV